MSKARELAELGAAYDSGALSNRNIIINGAMNVAQRATSATGVGSGFAYPTIDRYKIVPSTSGRATMTQTADGPAGFANCLKLECTTADTSIAASEYFNLRQSFEGQDLQRLKKGTSSAEKITVSFYVKGNATATYQCELADEDNTRYNGQTFAVTTDWTRVILTFDGDTTGALDDDTARSLDLNIWLHAGSTYTGGTFTSNTWQTTTNQRVGSITSFFDSTSRTFFITGLQMEVGTEATPFEHRSFADELARCQRYYFQLDGDSSDRIGVGGYAVGASEARMDVVFPCAMRAAPTISGTGTAQFDAHTDSADFNVSDMIIDEAPTGIMSGLGIQIASSSMVAGQSGGFRFRSTGTLSFSAEL
jgi:hypothetical protein